MKNTRGFRLDNPNSVLPKLGQYGKNKNGDWFGMTPNGHLANLSQHSITEHGDGSITVSPSILVSIDLTVSGRKELWHGYLEKGQWREC